MIIYQEQLGCDPLLAPPGIVSLPLQLVADLAEMPGNFTRPAGATGECIGDAGYEPEELPAVLMDLSRESRSPSDPCPVAAPIQDVDLRSCLDRWPYDPASNFRIGLGEDGR